jgi:hypothetical protein
MKYRILATILLLLALGVLFVYEENNSTSTQTHDSGGITLQ